MKLLHRRTDNRNPRRDQDKRPIEYRPIWRSEVDQWRFCAAVRSSLFSIALIATAQDGSPTNVAPKLTDLTISFIGKASSFRSFHWDRWTWTVLQFRKTFNEYHSSIQII